MDHHLKSREPAETRSVRTVRTTVANAVATSSGHRERHRQTNWLRDVILPARFVAAVTDSISLGASPSPKGGHDGTTQ